MKRILSVGFLGLFISSCGMHSNDPRPPHLRADVSTVANSVCVLVKPVDDEQIVTIHIAEVGNDENDLNQYNLNILAVNDRCAPDFGYKFELGKAYNFSIILESPSKKRKGIMPSARIFNAGFTLWDKNGEWEATTLY